MGAEPAARLKACPDTNLSCRGERFGDYTRPKVFAHVEAGLRSFDRSMPEINRLLTDQLADLLFTPFEDGDRNLLREGVRRERIHFVGNVMIDTLVRLLPKAAATLHAELPKHYALVTLHRPSNVDDLSELKRLLDALTGIGATLPIIFPVHP